MTARQRAIFWAVALLCAASRLLAVAQSPWDWDEVLFCHALRDYDLAQHHPHPPGYPVFVAMAKVASFVGLEGFRALQSVSVVASMLLLPAVFFFAREAGLRFPTALSAGVLCALFPPVWFFGGSAFSDVTSLVLVTASAAFLLRGRESPAAFVTGVVLLALAVGVRPQNVLAGMGPLVLAARRRSWRQLIPVAVLGIAVVAGAYGAAMAATGPAARFIEAFRQQSEYLLRSDSFLNPARPSLVSLLEKFFVRAYGPAHLSVLLTLLVVVGAVAGERRSKLVVLATFGPMALMTWLLLDRFHAARYAIAYAPMLAIFAALGVAAIARRFEAWACGAVALALVAWTIPALSEVRARPSPAMTAIEEVRRTRPQPLFVGHSMTAFVDYALPGVPYTRAIDARALPVRWERQPWLLADVTSRGGRYGPLWTFVRRQYFDVRLEPMRVLPEFDDGWSEDRVVRSRGVIRLPARGLGEMLLRLDLHVAPEARGMLIVRARGRELRRVPLGGISFLNLDHRLDAGPAELELEVQPPQDVRLAALSWGPR
jgi:hypothetical protein